MLSSKKKKNTKVRNNNHWLRNDTQKQPHRSVLSKRCSGNMQGIYRRAPIPSIFSEHLLLGSSLAGCFRILTLKLIGRFYGIVLSSKRKLCSNTSYLGDCSSLGIFSVLYLGLLTHATQTCQAVNSLR